MLVLPRAVQEQTWQNERPPFPGGNGGRGWERGRAGQREGETIVALMGLGMRLPEGFTM